jgi:hypothetical protein
VDHGTQLIIAEAAGSAADVEQVATVPSTRTADIGTLSTKATSNRHRRQCDRGSVIRFVGAVLASGTTNGQSSARYLGLDALAAARPAGEPSNEEVTEPGLHALTA